jgi:hypothetical protein
MAKSAAAAEKRKSSGDKAPTGSVDMTMAGAEILLKTLENEGVEGHLWVSRWRGFADL